MVVYVKLTVVARRHRSLQTITPFTQLSDLQCASIKMLDMWPRRPRTALPPCTAGNRGVTRCVRGDIQRGTGHISRGLTSQRGR